MPKTATDGDRRGHDPPLAMFPCPNPDCDLFNRFDAGNLSVCERMGKDQAIRRLYCNHCGHCFSERQGSLMEYAKLPKDTVVRIIKCLGHGCSIEATADICDVDARTVERILKRAGRRAAARTQGWWWRGGRACSGGSDSLEDPRSTTRRCCDRRELGVIPET